MPRKINLLIEIYSLLSWHHGIGIFKDQSAHGGVSDFSGDAFTQREQGCPDAEILVRKTKRTIDDQLQVYMFSTSLLHTHHTLLCTGFPGVPDF